MLYSFCASRPPLFVLVDNCEMKVTSHDSSLYLNEFLMSVLADDAYFFLQYGSIKIVFLDFIEYRGAIIELDVACSCTALNLEIVL